MRLATVVAGGEESAAVVAGDSVRLLPFPDLRALLRAHGDDLAGLPKGAEVGIESVRFAPPVPEPEKIVCVGLNFYAHAREAELTVPKYPVLFNKFSRALIGARDPIQLPRISDMVDWEVELCAVIGRPARDVDEDAALDCIAGYTIINDVSMRDYQKRTSQFMQGKIFEASTPVGPSIVTPGEVDHALSLKMRCLVDDLVVQESTTADQIHSPASVVSYISKIVTLLPGDMIAMGTPPGVGSRRKPPLFLREGNVLTSEIEGLGRLVNPCVMRAGETAGGATETPPEVKL